MMPVPLTFENIGRLRRLFVLSPLTVNQIIQELTQYVQETGAPVDLILVGGLALQAYGLTTRVTIDVDGKLVGELNPLVTFLQKRNVQQILEKICQVGLLWRCPLDTGRGLLFFIGSQA